MAQLLDELVWGEPILPEVRDAAWAAEVKRRAGQVTQMDRRTAPSRWLREMCVAEITYRPAAMPQRLYGIGALVTAQENACRYCYGANRALLRISGHPEAFISRLERDATLAEIDEKGRAFIAFCRSLARSRPRPMKADCDALVRLGFTREAVVEMALVIALACNHNRLGVLSACPPEHALEGLAGGAFAFATRPLLRLVMALQRPPQPRLAGEAELSAGPFGSILAAAAGVPAATIFRDALDGAFASPVLSRRTKALMFAIVARALGCRLSEDEARSLALADGLPAHEFDGALATLRSARLPAREERLLPWVRDTVYYQLGPIQQQTAALAREQGAALALEAIGVAALANAVVRLAVLRG